MKSILLATTVLAGLSGGAIAADAVSAAPVPAPLPVASAYNWTGGYIGAEVGGAVGGNVDEKLVNLPYYRQHPRGVFGGIFGGYNYQLQGGVVVGVEGDLNWGGVKASGDSIVSGPVFSATTKLDWTGSARVRLGYARDRFMPYVTGGFAAAHFRFDELRLGTHYGDASRDLTGWTVGAGAEYAVTDRWTLRAEYRYTQYGKENFVEVPSNERWEAKIRTHDLRVGVAYKF